MNNSKVENASTNSTNKSKEKVEKPSQISEVLKYLQTHDYITDAIAHDRFGAFRLSDIIFRLRKKGFEIETKTVTTKNRYGHTTNFAQYYLVN